MTEKKSQKENYKSVRIPTEMYFEVREQAQADRRSIIGELMAAWDRWMKGKRGSNG
jgi:hypothetical protein